MNNLAIIILNYNTKDLLRKCLKSIQTKKWKHSQETWVVDNASTDGSSEMIRKDFPDVKLIKSDRNRGFAGGNNLALQIADAKYYLLLNSDTEVSEGSLDALTESMARNGFDIASCKLVSPDGSFQPNAGDLPFGFPLLVWLFGIDDLPFLKNILPSFHRTGLTYYKNEKKVGWVSGSLFMFRSAVIRSIGLLDTNIFMYCEDVDYCIRAQKAGYTVGWTDKAQIMHIGGASSDNPKLRQWLGEFKELLYLQRKHKGSFAAKVIKILIYFSILLRMVGFFVLGKPSYTKTYRKVLAEL